MNNGQLIGLISGISKQISQEQVSIGILNISFVEPNIFRFTLSDNSTKDVIATGFNEFTPEEKAKLTSLDSNILTKFTLDSSNNLLYNGNIINSITPSLINGNILINGIETIIYTHPTNHLPSIITQDTNNRFVTDTEKSNWDNNITNLNTHSNDAIKHITSTERTNWNSASTNSHTHNNKTVLDNITASYTTEEKTKLSGIATNANNYTLPVANGTTIGGVKSGTDITIDVSGNVSVNDDSHNHIIDNVDGLQTALNGKESAIASGTTSQ